METLILLFVIAGFSFLFIELRWLKQQIKKTEMIALADTLLSNLCDSSITSFSYLIYNYIKRWENKWGDFEKENMKLNEERSFEMKIDKQYAITLCIKRFDSHFVGIVYLHKKDGIVLHKAVDFKN